MDKENPFNAAREKRKSPQEGAGMVGMDTGRPSRSEAEL